jgi:hypothetical protein
VWDWGGCSARESDCDVVGVDVLNGLAVDNVTMPDFVRSDAAHVI